MSDQPPQQPERQPYPQQPEQQRYPQQPWPQQPYPQQPQYVTASYAPGPPKGLSVTSMVLGLVSFFLGFTFIVPIVGFILGIVGLRREPAGRGMAITGLFLNGLFVLGWAALVFFIFVIGLGGIAASTSN